METACPLFLSPSLSLLFVVINHNFIIQNPLTLFSLMCPADKAFTGTDSAETMESLARVATVKLGLIDSVALADDNFSSFNKVN